MYFPVLWIFQFRIWGSSTAVLPPMRGACGKNFSQLGWRLSMRGRAGLAPPPHWKLAHPGTPSKPLTASGGKRGHSGGSTPECFPYDASWR